MTTTTTTPTVRTDALLDVACWLGEAFAGRAAEADKQGRLPPEDIRDLSESGYLACNIPTELGGLGLPMADCIEAHLEVAKGSASTSIVAGMTLQTMGNQREQQNWQPGIYERLAAAIVEGGVVNSVASEPNMGSPSRGAFYETNAELTAEGWLINGHKQWITGGRHLTHMIVKLSIGEESAAILVPGDAPGLDWRETWGDSLSLRASDSDDLYLNDVLVPEENLVTRGDVPSKGPNAWFPMVVAAVYLGSALAARDALIRYALERVPTALGKPIAALPKIQRQVGEIDMRLQAARTLLLDAAARWDPNNREAGYPLIVTAKEFATQTAADCAEAALRAAGGSAISRTLPLERYFRDAQAGSMHPPSGDTALEIVGRTAIERLGDLPQ